MEEQSIRGGLVPGGEDTSHDNGGVGYKLEDSQTHIEEEGLEVNIPIEILNLPGIYKFTGANFAVLNDILKLGKETSVGELSLASEVSTVRGGDVVICKRSVWDKAIRTYEGTIKQIVSAINESGACNPIEAGAKIIDHNTDNLKAKGGKIPQRYKDIGFSRVGQKKKSTRPEKKWMVLAKKGDKYKVVHGGQKGMEDFSQHKDKKRQRRFWERMGGFDSEKTQDPFSPLYWHKKFGTWEKGGVLEDGTIKVAWVDSDTPDIMESKMFDSIEDAIKYSEGKKFLIFELEDSHDDYYKWSILPYGMYSKYKMALEWADKLNLEKGGEAISYKLIPNDKGGFDYEGEASKIAKTCGLVTLPKSIEGTNCGNCIFQKDGFCDHYKVLLPVTSRMCCSMWDDKSIRSIISNLFDAYLFPPKPENTFELNEEGGYNYTGKALEKARAVDLITLPEDIKGTTCAIKNCMYAKSTGESGDVKIFCNHPRINLPVTDRMSCGWWDNQNVKREWGKPVELKFSSGGKIPAKQRVEDWQANNPNSPRWQKKKESLEQLSNEIQRLRSKVTRDLKSEDEKEFLTALVIAVILNTGERIGNNDSADNGHFGVTGFTRDHITVTGNKIHLDYVGKKGVPHKTSFSDKRIAEALKKAIKNSPKEVNGKKNKFIFVTSDGFRIKDEKVNRYLDEFGITSKALRGYVSNNFIIKKLSALPIPETEKQRKKLFNKIAKDAAHKVGHLVPTMKKHYMIPELPIWYIQKGKIINTKKLGYYNDGGNIGDIAIEKHYMNPNDVPEVVLKAKKELYKQAEGKENGIDDIFKQYPVEEVLFETLIPTQDFLKSEKFKKLDLLGENIEETTPSYIIRNEGKQYVIDGHHRCVKRHELNKPVLGHIYNTSNNNTMTNLEKGIKVEKEHRDLYLEIQRRLADIGVEMPISEEEFYAEIAKAHLKERQDYYELLDKYVEKYAGDKVKSKGGEAGGKDLFEQYAYLPSNIRKLIDEYNERFESGDEDLYKLATEMKKKFNAIGYDFEYGLDAVAFNLHKINKKDITMALGGVIGEKKAKEIIKYVLSEAKKEDISLPKLQKFFDEGAKPGTLLEAYEEFSYAVNNGENPKSLRLAYDDSVKFRDYVMQYFPNKSQREMYKHYGEAKIKKEFPNYAKGGTITEKEIDSHSYGFEDEQIASIKRILPAVKESLSGKITSWGSGGNFYHLSVQLKDNRWLTFNSGTGDITVSSKPIKTAKGAYDASWDDDTMFFELYIPTGDAENFDNTEEIVKAITESKFSDSGTSKRMAGGGMIYVYQEKDYTPQQLMELAGVSSAREAIRKLGTDKVGIKGLGKVPVYQVGRLNKGGHILSNKEIIKNLEFEDQTDTRHGMYSFSFSTEDVKGADVLDYDGNIIESSPNSRMNDEIEWGQNTPEDWEGAEEYITDKFYEWKRSKKRNSMAKGGQQPEVFSPGSVEYKTIDIRSEKGIREAEALQRQGWIMGSSGGDSIQFYRQKRSPLSTGKRMDKGGEMNKENEIAYLKKLIDSEKHHLQFSKEHNPYKVAIHEQALKHLNDRLAKATAGVDNELKKTFYTLPKSTPIHAEGTKIVIERNLDTKKHPHGEYYLYSVYMETLNGEKYWKRSGLSEVMANKRAKDFKDTIEAGYDISERKKSKGGYN